MSSNETWIVGGRVVDPANKIDTVTNIRVENGRVAELTTAKAPSGATVIDAQGKVVTPGLIDMHVHLREPGYEYKETIESGLRAAVAGGFTAVACMANTKPVNDCASVMEAIVSKGKAAGLAHLFPIGALTKGLAGKELADIGDLKTLGAVALSDDGMVLDDTAVLFRAMEYASTFGLPVISHCEDNGLAAKGVMHEGVVSTRLGLAGRPAEAEVMSIYRDMHIARLAGCHLHVAHLSTAAGVALIRQAKRDGFAISTEVSPHHLTLTDEACDGYNVNAKMSPPLRTQSDCDALLMGLGDGTIDAVATDHAPHATIDKEVGFDLATPGIVGLETSFPLCFGRVDDKRLTLTRLIEAMAPAPAKILKLNKGTLSVGADADLAVFDCTTPYTIDANQFYSKGRNTPFHGWKVKGRAVTTMVSGRVVHSL